MTAYLYFTPGQKPLLKFHSDKIQNSVQIQKSFLNNSQDNFSKNTKDGRIMHKQLGSCSHAKNLKLILITITPFFKNDIQM